MPAQKKVVASGGAAGGASSGGGQSDLQQESEWLEGMSKLLGWMYEHCSRYQMDEALQGLIQSAERRFNLAQDEIMAKADPFAQLKRWLRSHKYTLALKEFEFICPQQMDRSANSVYAKTLNSIKIQTVLKTLRGNSEAISEFKSQVTQLFPAPKKGQADAKFVEQIRAELLGVSTEAQVTSLLNKYNADNFNEVTSAFWIELRKHRQPTVLEVVLSDVSDGTYQPRIALHSSPQIEAEEEEEAAAGTQSQASAPPAVPPSQPAPKEEPASKSKEEPADAEAGAAAKRGAGAPGPAKTTPTAAHASFVLSAWDLRKALANAGGEDDEADFSDIHAQTHPDIQDFLTRRGIHQKAQKAGAGTQQPQSEPEPAGKPDAQPQAKRKRPETPSSQSGEGDEEADDDAEEEEEEDMMDEEEDKVSAVEQLLAERREGRVRGARGAGGRPAAAKHGRRDNEKENELPKAVEKARASTSEGPEVVKELKELRESARSLMGAARDPLADARKISKTANAENGSKRIRLDSSSPGEKVSWTDEEEEEEGVPVQLPSPKNLAYQPRARLSRGSGGAGGASSPAAAAPRSRKTRWTDEEVEKLKDGVKRCGEGNWREILDSKKFHSSRTAVDLKDKWRNLKKYNHV